jgi:glycosyltransferase involved in cell wall biosynthesis
LLQADDSRLEEIPNGVDVERFNPTLDGRLVKARYGIDPEAGHVLVFVGAMDRAHHPKSGVTVLLEAVASLRDRSLTVLLVGGGDMIGEYAALARAIGIAERTHFVGRVGSDELGRYYAAADVVVQPSQLFETFGMVAIEAMACGRPVIASDLPGARRVVSDAGGGLLAKPGDVGDLAAKIGALTRDPALRGRLGSAGRAAVEARYPWGRIGLMLDRAYREALASP